MYVRTYVRVQEAAADEDEVVAENSQLSPPSKVVKKKGSGGGAGGGWSSKVVKKGGSGGWFPPPKRTTEPARVSRCFLSLLFVAPVPLSAHVGGEGEQEDCRDVGGKSAQSLPGKTSGR